MTLAEFCAEHMVLSSTAAILAVLSFLGGVLLCAGVAMWVMRQVPPFGPFR